MLPRSDRLRGLSDRPPAAPITPEYAAAAFRGAISTRSGSRRGDMRGRRRCAPAEEMARGTRVLEAGLAWRSTRRRAGAASIDTGVAEQGGCEQGAPAMPTRPG